MIRIRPVGEEDWQDWRALRHNALRDSPGAFSSALADWQGEGDVEQRWRDRLSDVPFNVIVELDAEPVGMVSAVAREYEVELLSMWVAPNGRGRGVGDALIRAALRWAADQGRSNVILRVVEDNEHAIALYRRHGFEDAGRAEPNSPRGRAERQMIFDGHSSPD